MNIVATALLLIFTLLVVPVVSFIFGTQLGPGEIAALQAVLWILLCAWLSCFILGELTSNVSQVDKVWSLLPIVYVWVVAHHGDYSPRLLLMAMLVTAWGVRLTYNFSRHGAYRLKFWSGKEDYRWQVLREKPEFKPAWKWTLFNFGFISGYQEYRKNKRYIHLKLKVPNCHSHLSLNRNCVQTGQLRVSRSTYWPDTTWFFAIP